MLCREASGIMRECGKWKQNLENLREGVRGRPGLEAVGCPVTKELTHGKIGDASLVLRTLHLKALLHFPKLVSGLADLLLSTQDDISLLSVPFSWASGDPLALYVIGDAALSASYLH